MVGAGFRLGVDFGTSHTVAMLRWPDGRCRPVLFDGSPLLPSAVYADAAGQLQVGRDALQASRVDPARFDPAPKRRVDAPTVSLGQWTFPVTSLFAAVLARVKDEAVRLTGGQAFALTMTYPADWGVSRRLALAEAATEAGLPEPELVAEPVAAATYFAGMLGHELPVGAALAVYDFGGGTFDASVVRAAPPGGVGQTGTAGYEIVAVDGLDDVGGIDLDAAIVDHLGERYAADHAAAWRRLTQPETTEDRRGQRLLWEDVRAAKEMLSRTSTVTIPVPLLGIEAELSRDQFAEVARPVLERTVRTTAAVIRWAKVTPAAIILVGGSSRIPLVAELLREATGISPTTLDQPELVVAEGSVTPAPIPASERPTVPQVRITDRPTLVDRPLASPAPPPTSPAPPLARPTQPPAWPVQPPPAHPVQRPPVRPPARKGRVGLVVLVAILLAGLGTAAVIFLPKLGGDPGGAGGTSPNPARYVREERPAWVGDRPLILQETGNLFTAGPATNGGSCTYEAPNALRVTRSGEGVSGCPATATVKNLTVASVAIEAQLAVQAGCAGLWARTGNQGYFLMTCADGSVALHLLHLTDPGSATELRRWTPAFNPRDVIVGLLAENDTFTVYVDGVAQPGVVVDTALPTGRVALGGYAPPGSTLDATITGWKVWA
jgi:hypothetical protein